jgi:hypothetical protein
VVRHFQQKTETNQEVQALTAREMDVLEQLSKGFL